MHSLFDGWKKFLLLPAALLLVVGLGTGCSDDDDDKNGGGPGGVDEQITFGLDGAQYTGDLCMAHYMVDDGETSITSGDGENWAFTFEFPGSSTGTFTAAEGISVMLAIAPHMYVSEEFTVTITAYGGIGGAVTGTFSGTVVHIADEDDVKQITNGTFTAERMPNI